MGRKGATAMVFLISWVVFSVVIGWVWSARGHSGFAGFVLSLLLSPLIGLIVGLVKTPNQEVLERRQVGSGARRTCPFCAELIKNEAVVCRYCGKDLPALEVPAKEQPLETNYKLIGHAIVWGGLALVLYLASR